MNSLSFIEWKILDVWRINTENEEIEIITLTLKSYGEVESNGKFQFEPPLYYSPMSRFHLPMGVLLYLNGNCPYSCHDTKDSDLPKE